MTARVVGPAGLCQSVEALWERGLPPGDKSGWPSLDKHYTVACGQLTVVTGWPGSGKSEWLDALLVNLWHQGWKFAIFSPENRPVEIHAAKLLEKVSGKPFGHGPTERLARDELRTLMVDELAGSFAFMDSEDGESLTAREVIEAAEPWFANFPKAKRGLVIDPWNELEHWRPQNLSETEYISQTLSYVRNWARRNSIHVWIVAHPQKMRREKDELPVPKPDMISGSQHWWNKADAAITVWRDLANPDDQSVQVHVQKIRFKHIGRPGIVDLKYDRVTGRYHEAAPNIYDAKAKR